MRATTANGRQYEVADNVQELRGVAVDHQRLPEEEVGAGVVVAECPEVIAAGGRQPMEPDTKHVLEKQAQEEDRDADANERGHGREVVEERVLALGGRHAQRDADPYCQEHGRHGEFDRGRKAGQETGRDRDLVRRRYAEVAVDYSSHVVQVLLIQRLVQPEAMLAAGDVRGRGMFAQDRSAWVARQHVQEDDHQQRQPEQDRY